MNFPLAKEIYGQAWSVDAVSLMHLTSILKNIQNGVALDAPEQKLNSVSILEIKGETRLINDHWDLKNSDSFEGIGIINLNGAITKNGGASTNGTMQMSNSMLQMSKDNRVKGFIIKTDSGGGSSAAVQLMIDAINKTKAIKPVYALVEKGGMAGSAAYGIISACTGIYSEDGMNIVGSVGTMISFSGTPHGNVDKNGEKTVVLYATKSTMKNKAFDEAINGDNYELLINELLDPINENFIASILANRPQLEGSSFDNGHTAFSKDSVGTFIDGIASFDEVVNMILSDTNTGVNKNQNNNLNSNKMNKEEIKQQHPAVYSEILQEGIAQEKERRSAWNVFREVDSKAVEAGIESGLIIKQSETSAFLLKATSNAKVNDLQGDNAVSFTTNETSTDAGSEVSSKQKELDKAFNF
ncbi:MAG: Flavobacterium phage [Bacteroidota bacterium]